MADRLFGTDGIRGVANVHPMTAEMALKVGRAAGYIFQQEERPHTILIGKDTRRSGYMLENALTAGLCSMGVHALLVGPLPTPGVSYIMRSLRDDARVVIRVSRTEPVVRIVVQHEAKREAKKLAAELANKVKALLTSAKERNDD